MHGGDWVAEVLQAQGVAFVFTLTGGHIAPILVGCKQRGIRVIDTRHEANAVFAADAVARLTGVPGVAVVTAGPGVTNTLTAVKNAQMAQSPVIVLGGAAATMLQGRGALQDIDQLALFKSVVKWSASVRRVRDVVPMLERAFRIAQSDVPGPVFVELPIDLLYDETVVRELYGAQGGGKTLGARAVNAWLRLHVARLFLGSRRQRVGARIVPRPPAPDPRQVTRVAEALRAAARPLLVLGSQVVLDIPTLEQTVAAINQLGVPVYLSGMARGLLGAQHPLQMRHKRRDAIKGADFVLLAGVPADFRLDYGRQIRSGATYVAVNRSKADLALNRRPTISVPGDPALFLRALAATLAAVPAPTTSWAGWIDQLRVRDAARNAEIAAQSHEPTGKINPLHLLLELERQLPDNAILVADGGDFVGTASYILNPRGPLRWLDPGPFGTLGVGAGFALGARLARPDAEVWIIYGDGSSGYSIAEYDTFARHNVAVAAVIGNDASWAQIAREQQQMLGDLVGTQLVHTDYDRVVNGFGGAGVRIDDPELVPETIEQARAALAAGRPVLINAIIGRSDFRKGSISV